MTNTSFNDTLDRALRGKYVRVHTETGVFEGWVDRVQHDRGSVVLRDATNTTTDESLGSVFIRVCEAVEVLKPRKRIEFVPLEELSPYPEYDIEFTPEDDIIRRCYRNQFPGSFPVVRENGTILDGHKRVAAAEIAGLERLPVEVIAVTDQQAADLFRVAHRDDAERADTPTESDAVTADGTDDTERETEDTEDERSDDSGVVFGYDV
jgi:ParB-like nuclease domain.